MPDTAKDTQFRKYLLEDINLALGIKAYIDTQDIACYRLVALKDCLSSKDSSYVRKEDPNEGTYVVYHNWLLQKLISYFDYYSDTPVIDGSPGGCRVNLKLHTDNLRNYPALRKELQAQGLDLVPSTARLPVIVVADAKE